MGQRFSRKARRELVTSLQPRSYENTIRGNEIDFRDVQSNPENLKSLMAFKCFRTSRFPWKWHCFPTVSPDAHPLTRKSEDSGYWVRGRHGRELSLSQKIPRDYRCSRTRKRDTNESGGETSSHCTVGPGPKPWQNVESSVAWTQLESKRPCHYSWILKLTRCLE